MPTKTAVAAGALAALTFALPIVAKDRRPTTDPLYDIVAVGRGAGKIILATLAGPSGTYHWRFRTILLSKDARVSNVLLSKGATKALIVFADGTSRVLDLTERVSAVGPAEIQTAQHKLPSQLFAVSQANQTCLVNDAGTAVACRDAVRATMGEGGRVLYATQDGRLLVASIGGSSSDESLAYRLPGDAKFELLARPPDDAHEFLVVVERDGKVSLIDPASGVELAAYGKWELAALRGALGAPVGETALRAALENLMAEARPGTYAWSFFRVQPEVVLYTPVLEFAANEPAYPSDTKIWNELNPKAHEHTLDAYVEAYHALGQGERRRHCKVYFREVSYPGSWLLEFWFYYIYDAGKPHEHIHDSEHIFVEVDKLGGSVRSVLASAHGSWAPNNNYSTFLRDARPVKLPLFAMVEYGKHAMAPDINHTGTFTRGVDVNMYRDRYEVWGVRDIDAKKGRLMEPYRPFMTLPRKKEDRFALENLASFFPGVDVDQEKATCGLLPFPRDPSCQDCEAATPASAEAHLTAHSDARNPWEIYKPWVLPWRQIRVGLGAFDHQGNGAQLYAAYVSELRHLLRGHSPVPGRLSFEFMWSPASRTHTSAANGQTVHVRISSPTYFGLRYERFLTNAQGFYGGATPLFVRSATDIGGGPPAPQWEYQGVWYRLGYILELPSRKRGNLTHHLGVAFHGTTFRFEWRVSIGLLRRQGRSTFGIRKTDPNPYE